MKPPAWPGAREDPQHPHLLASHSWPSSQTPSNLLLPCWCWCSPECGAGSRSGLKLIPRPLPWKELPWVGGMCRIIPRGQAGTQVVGGGPSPRCPPSGDL